MAVGRRKPRKPPNNLTAVTHKGTPVSPHLKPWKPGQSGNPRGRPKGSKPKSLMDHLHDVYEEPTEHEKRQPDGRPYMAVISKLEKQARVVADAALGEGKVDPALRRECTRAVLDRLAPIEQQRAEPFIDVHIYHDGPAQTFIAALQQNASVTGPVTPQTVLEALQKRNGKDSAEYEP